MSPLELLVVLDWNCNQPEVEVSDSTTKRARGRLSPARASWLSAMMLFPLLSIVAEILISRTHHRPLGAAVFATVAVLAWIFAEITSRRSLDADVCKVRARNRKIAWFASGFFTLVVLGRVFL